MVCILTLWNMLASSIRHIWLRRGKSFFFELDLWMSTVKRQKWSSVCHNNAFLFHIRQTWGSVCHIDCLFHLRQIWSSVCNINDCLIFNRITRFLLDGPSPTASGRPKKPQISLQTQTSSTQIAGLIINTQTRNFIICPLEAGQGCVWGRSLQRCSCECSWLSLFAPAGGA